MTLFVDGRRIAAAPGDSVAAALLLAGIVALRMTPASGAARGLYCGMGVCFDCLVTIDGEGNRQACMIPVRDGMLIATGAGRRDLAADAAT